MIPPEVLPAELRASVQVLAKAVDQFYFSDGERGHHTYILLEKKRQSAKIE